MFSTHFFIKHLKKITRLVTLSYA